MMNKGVSEQGRGCVSEIVTLKQIGEKAREKKMQSVCRLYGLGEGI